MDFNEKFKRNVLKKRCAWPVIDPIYQKTTHLCNKKIIYLVYCYNKNAAIFNISTCCEEHFDIATKLDLNDIEEKRYIKIQPLIEI